MKIYNEVVIDMNPESPSYGETLHEDSYEYEGDMMLMQGGVSDFEAKIVYVEEPYGGDWRQHTWTGSEWKPSQSVLTKNVADVDEWEAAGSAFRSLSELHAAHDAVRAESGFTYTGGDYDPTSSEFRESVGRTGGFGEISEGYGFGEQDFDEFYGAPLKKIKQDYGTGMKSLTAQTGKSLENIYSQTETAQVKSGFESSGSIDYTSKKAETGAMGEYLTQKKSLSDQLAFSTEDFWKTTEDDYYTELEANKASM
jgi:hypothetical protein